MDKKTLDQTHPTYDADRWSELEALAKGGKRFHALIDRFLPQNPMEPDLMYEARKKRAKYYSYTGSIINLYVSWLFAASFSVKPYKLGTEEPQTPDPFYGIFQEDVGKETSLTFFMKERFREAMTKRKSSWLVEMPGVPAESTPNDRAEWEAMGLGRARLTPIDPTELLDWETDDEGNYVWAIVKTVYTERTSPKTSRSTTVETWRVYDAETVTTYELRYDKKAPAAEKRQNPKQLGEPTKHGCRRVPIITLELPEEMCIGEQTYDAQLSHFRLDAGLDWAIMRTCYAMPVFNIEDDDKRPTMGVGYGLYLGKEEKMTWSSPPSESFDVIGRDRDAKRDEIFRIVHQMAQGLDNNAETVGRSADSKEIDAAATRIMLNAYGEIVARAIEETYETISEARGEADYEWSVEGFSGYDTATASSLLGNTKLAKDIGIPSNTFLQEISTKAALALVPEVDQKVKDKIRDEISKYKFEVTGKTVDAALQSEQLRSQEKTAEASLKSQEKTAVAVAKAKPAPTSAPNPKKP